MPLLDRLQTGLNAIYPARCLTCGDLVESDYGLCGPCWRDTSFIGGALCDACGVPLPGEDDGTSHHCDDCMQRPRPWVRGRSAILYRDTGRLLVLGLKHGDRQEISKPSSLWMAQVAQPLVADQTLIAPVPLHWQRMIKRRYNQSALLAKSLAEQLELPVCLDLLQRYRRTKSLDGLNRQARQDAVANAIRTHQRRRHRLIGRPVLLIDDVMTTGATLAACAEACLAAGSGEVSVLTLARAAKDT